MTKIGSVYIYDNGQSPVDFWWDGAARDGYVWSTKRGIRLASYSTRREVAAAFKRSDNSRGAYGCAALCLDGDA